MQKILITGGAGFIGSRLALALSAKGHQVRVLDNLSPQIHGETPEQSPLYRTIAGKVDFIRGSVTSRDDLAQALQGINTVVHLAAETGTGQSMYAIQHYSDVNVGGTALLLDIIANKPYPVEKLVVASSRAIYGEGCYHCAQHGMVYPAMRTVEAMQNGQFEPLCPACAKPVSAVATDESTPGRPSSIYGVTKLAQEQLVLTFGQALGISALAFRYQNVYGPGQSLSNPYTGILSIFSTRILNGNPINIFEDGRESRDFIYIDDVVAATVLGIEHPSRLVDVFNVGSGTPVDVMTVASLLQSEMGRSVPTSVSGQFRAGDIRHNYADLSKISGALGFKPSVQIREGLARFIAWVKQEQVQPDRFEQTMQELKMKGLLNGRAE